jgi:hypothetical protein
LPLLRGINDVRHSSRLLLACLVAPFAVPLVVFPLGLLQAARGGLTTEEAMLQAATWAAFGIPAALMALVVFWIPLHLWLHGYAVRSASSHLAAAVTIAAVLVYIAAIGLPGTLEALTVWHWAAFAGAVLAVGSAAWWLATAGGRR